MKYLNIIFILFLIACNEKNSTKAIDNSVPQDSISEKIQKENWETKLSQCQNLDTIINEKEVRIEIKKVGKSEFELTWGNANFQRKYPNYFECWKMPNEDICDFTPKIESINNDYIIMRVTTGTPNAGNCSPIEFKMIYLPLNEKESTFEMEYFLKMINPFAIYTNSLDTIFVINLKTRKTQSMELDPFPYFEFKTIDYSIDSIRIINNKLRFQYLIGTHEDYNFVERKMKLKI